jgi:2-polyprenyl-3-methyl-5-hydroxy-6-metoxy-1,4-benzoquinol methylase
MKCRICDSGNLSSVIDLGMQPWCNNFLTKEQIGKEPYYPLNLVYCNDCNASQLNYTVKKEIMFSDHTYLSGVTSSLSNHFKSISKEITSFFKKQKIANKNILDIGSNDGTQLVHYKNLGWNILGVESSKKTAEIAIKNEIPTINKFFNLELAKEIDSKFTVINAAGVFFHLEELHSVSDGIKYLLDKNGVFVVQFLYMKSIGENNAFDQIYHEHLLYYTLNTLSKLLGFHDLEIFDAYLTEIHGGQMIAYVSHPGAYDKTSRLERLLVEEEKSNCNSISFYNEFNKRIKIMKKENRDFLENEMIIGNTVYAMGAPVKGNTLLNFFDIGTDLIPYLIEKNVLRKNLFSPGKHIPILIEDELKFTPNTYYVLAWNFKKEILENNKILIDKGVNFYFPINPKEIY